MSTFVQLLHVYDLQTIFNLQKISSSAKVDLILDSTPGRLYILLSLSQTCNPLNVLILNILQFPHTFLIVLIHTHTHTFGQMLMIYLVLLYYIKRNSCLNCVFLIHLSLNFALNETVHKKNPVLRGNCKCYLVLQGGSIHVQSINTSVNF